MTAACCETAALVIQVIFWVINLIKSGSSNFSKVLPLFHPVDEHLTNNKITDDKPSLALSQTGGIAVTFTELNNLDTQKC